MQRCLVVLAGLLLSVPGSALSVSVTAKAGAVAWLHAHPAPQQDELAELKAVNPSAYALVKALLTKRSLGLLDPRNPTPSFAASAASADAPLPGPEAFEKIAEESGEKPHAALSYPDAPEPVVHRNWLSWKPSQSATDDEAMVNNVLGAVAQLKSGGSGSQHAEGESSSALSWDSARTEDAAAPLPKPVLAEPAAPATSAMNQENSFLKNVDFGVDVPQKPVQQQSENSYLKGIDLMGTSDAAPSAKKAHASLASQDSNNYLGSFSWDDNTPAKPAAAAPAAGSASEATPAVSGNAGPKNTLFAWLDGQVTKATPVPQAPKPQQVQSLRSNYMSYLQ